MGKIAFSTATKGLSKEDRELLESARKDAIAYAEEKKKRAQKKKKGAPTAHRKKKGMSIEIEQELNKLSDLSLDNVSTNLDLLKEMRRLLLSSLETTRGAVRSNPKPSNIYAMTKLTTDILTLTKAIEDALDYNELAESIFNKVLKPFLDTALLDLGSHIHDTLEKYASEDKTKYAKLEKMLTEAYRKFGTSLEGKIPNMQTKLKRTIITFAK